MQHITYKHFWCIFSVQKHLDEVFYLLFPKLSLRNYIYQGEEYAHGTMGSALECALAGLLPKLVSDRLGVYGDAPTKEQARKIIDTNKINKERANE